MSSTSNGGIHEIRWLFPIYGIPESQPVKDSQCLVVECQARDTIEQRLEVQLSGVVPSVGSQHKMENPKMLLRDKTPSAGSRDGPESVVVGESEWSFFLFPCCSLWIFFMCPYCSSWSSFCLPTAVYGVLSVCLLQFMSSFCVPTADHGVFFCFPAAGHGVLSVSLLQFMDFSLFPFCSSWIFF